ncbi:MAG TPA: methionyl-tRNA formyltransferase [Candidatus Binataceae bacterium]|nr:methionyl-tRNA formyltransferase [Candidatus Binataceae bacterium]
MVFMGTPALAAHILDRLAAASGDKFQIVAVVTQPDRPRGRKLEPAPSEVAVAANRHGIPTLKPEKIRTREFLGGIEALAPDLLVVAAYGRILPEGVLNAPRIAPINIHASLLPRFRGAAPVEAAILAGDSETGVTLIRMTAKMDAGPVYLKRAIPIAPDDTQGSVKEKLAELGASAVLEGLNLLIAGRLDETPQDESLATYCKPVEKNDAVIDWNQPAAQVERMIRAYDPWPVARTTLDGSPLMIWRAAINAAEPAGVPGEIISISPAPVVKCGTGALSLLEVQAPGRKRMPAADFFRGRRIGVGTRMGE